MLEVPEEPSFGSMTLLIPEYSVESTPDHRWSNLSAWRPRHSVGKARVVLAVVMEWPSRLVVAKRRLRSGLRMSILAQRTERALQEQEQAGPEESAWVGKHWQAAERVSGEVGKVSGEAGRVSEEDTVGLVVNRTLAAWPGMAAVVADTDNIAPQQGPQQGPQGWHLQLHRDSLAPAREQQSQLSAALARSCSRPLV
jgi:hypothetical protein